MKKILTLAMALIMCVSLLCSCSSDPGDWDYLTEKGKMIIGYTLYEPMNYKDADGKLVGFDTEFAEAVCAQLGLTPEFVEINWETKETELNAKNIDAVWNGFTVNAERKEQFAFSDSYVANKQVVVVKKDNASKYTDLASLAGAKCAAEKKSAGETAILTTDAIKSNEYIPCDKQTDVLTEILSGTVEFGVLDYIMVRAMIGAGTDYESLVMIESIELPPEEYAIGFRKNCPDTVAKVNEAIQAIVENGKMAEIAEKYGLTDQLAPGVKK